MVTFWHWKDWLGCYKKLNMVELSYASLRNWNDGILESFHSAQQENGCKK